jgi:hypothetical protein
LAVLAQSAVPGDYEIRVGDVHGTVGDLVDYEKRTCRSGGDLSGKLIGLTYYLKGEKGWQNELGEDWSIERLIEEEMVRTEGLSQARLTRCLMGLSYAVDRRLKRGKPIEGEFLRARQYLAKVQQYALDQQNPEGTWHPSFFTHKGSSRDVMGTLRSTGHILRWLVFSLPRDRLQDARMVRSVVYVSNLLNGQGRGWQVASMSPRDMDSVMHAAHALAMYDRRVFRAEPEEPEKIVQTEETEERETAEELEERARDGGGDGAGQGAGDAGRLGGSGLANGEGRELSHCAGVVPRRNLRPCRSGALASVRIHRLKAGLQRPRRAAMRR